MKYNPDSRLMQFLTKLADLMILNIVFIIFSIPVFTIGASWTALYYVALKMVRDEQSGIISAFARSFKENFRQATVLWIAVLLVGGLLFFDIYVVDSIGSTGAASLVRFTVLVLLLLLLMLLQYLFPMLSKFSSTTSAAVKNAALMAIGNFPKTVIMCLITAFPVILTLINDYTMILGIFLWGIFIFALIAVANSCLLADIFDKFISKPDGESGNSENEQNQEDY